MSRYQVMLSQDLEDMYKTIAEQLEMSMEQVLSSAVQLYAERLTLQAFDGICNVQRVEAYEERRRKAAVHE